MATVYTHAVVGLGLGKAFTGRRMPWWFWALAALLPVVPDFDAFWSWVPYGSWYGHRGFTHSLLLGFSERRAGAVVTGCVVSFPRFRDTTIPIAKSSPARPDAVGDLQTVSEATLAVRPAVAGVIV